MEFITANIAPIMFCGLIVFLMIGYPVAFSLAACGLLFGVYGIYEGLITFTQFKAIPERIYGIMYNELLMAIPFFTFMGLILERSGMAEDLLDTVGQVFGPVRGGLALAVVLVGALLAATTGVVAASVISMGLISLPIMMRYGYDHRLASGAIAASGTLAQIIPPSLVLIVLADQLSVPVGDIYRAAFVPGFMLMLFYVSYVLLIAFLFKDKAPAIPVSALRFKSIDGKAGYPSLFFLLAISILVMSITIYYYDVVHIKLAIWKIIKVADLSDQAPVDEMVVISIMFGFIISYLIAVINKVFKLGLLSKLTQQVTFVLMPPLALIFLVLGTIFLGIASPTEGGAMGAVGAMLLAFSKRAITLKNLYMAMQSTARLTSFVIFILVGATVFTVVFRFVNGDTWVANLLSSLPGGKLGFLIVINILVFVLAFFLDFFELAFIIVPLIKPVADLLGIDPVWFGVLLAINMQTSFMHPPFGFSLFYLRSVAPKEPYIDVQTGKKMPPITTGEIYWGAIPFVCIQIVMVILIITFPNIVYTKTKSNIDIDSIKIEAPSIEY